MKKRICALLLVLMLTLTFPAYAESAQPENALSIADSFDPADWSFGELDWISTFEDYLKLLDFEDEVLLKSEQHEELFELTRKMYVSEFERECDVRHSYQYGVLFQVRINARAADEAEYLTLVDKAEAAYKAMSEAYGAVEPLNTLADDQGMFERMRTPSEDGERVFWSSQCEAAQYKGKPLSGIISAYYQPINGEYEIGFTFGVSPKNPFMHP